MSKPEMSNEQIIAAARRVIERQFVGVFTTVDSDGRPHSRWMGAATDGDGLARVLAVSARGARKLDQIAGNPNVCWLFSDAHDNEVVTLIGTAKILEDQTLAGPAWDAVRNAAQKYAMSVISEPENLWFVGIEVTLTQVEYMCPKAGLTHPVVVKV